MKNYSDQELEQIREEFEKSLKHIDGLVCVSLGLKETGVELIRETCLKVYVEKKVSHEQVPEGQFIPETYKGLKTDVTQVPTAKLQEDSSKYRPLMGGIQIGNQKGIHIGTLGCLATLKSDGTTVLLSNNHVLYSDGAQAGDKIGQPSYSGCSSCCVCNAIATIVNGQNNGPGGVDCAIARLEPGVNFTNELNGLNALVTTGMALNDVIDPNAKGVSSIYGMAAPVQNKVVFKVGRTTGRTVGIIVTASAPVNVTQSDGTLLLYNNQIHIRHYNSLNDKFSDGGDSGSAIITEDNQIVGLLFAGNDAAPYYTYANNIQTVVNAMSIDINYTGTALSIPIIEQGTDDGNTMSNEEILLKFEKELQNIPYGKNILDIIYKHQSEVIKLINTNREVKVAWNRYQGPAFIAHFMKSSKKEGHEIPQQINGVLLQNLLVKMAVVLEAHGGEALREDVNKYGLEIMTCLNGCHSVKNLLEFIKSKELEPQL